MDFYPYLMPLVILGILMLLMYLFFIRPISKGFGSGITKRVDKKILNSKNERVTFEDVAGIDYVREELEEIVDLLKNPEKYSAIGAKVPKGVLCIGEPGTGKTLMARAVAGEADCAFFSVSGSDFIEIFVGVGASRVRKMFAEARKNAPCIIFIDEIDAIGGHRGSGVSGGHSEREQTLNQLLVEMDGFDPSEGVVIMAATNRADSLDKALLRPGRFDRTIVVDLPSCKERLEILKVHAKRIKMSEQIDLLKIAKSTPGASGADLANLLNEAALIAVKEDQEIVSMEHCIKARDKVFYGKERKGKSIKEKDKISTAYHEAGHAIVSIALESENEIEKVTIIPRGVSLGATHFLPEDDKVTMTKEGIEKEIVIALSGRASEQTFLGNINSGAVADITYATKLSRNYVCSFGMDQEVGMVKHETGYQVESGAYRPSEKILQKIDERIELMTKNAFDKAVNILKIHEQSVKDLANALIEFETIYAEDVHSIFNGTWDKSKRIQTLTCCDNKPACEEKEAVQSVSNENNDITNP